MALAQARGEMNDDVLQGQKSSLDDAAAGTEGSMGVADDSQVTGSAETEQASNATTPRGRGAGARGRRGGGASPERFEITADRPIFTLSVAADLLGLHPRTLRIYEEKKLVIPSRTEGNRRRYSQRDIQRFQFIRHLTAGGVNLEGVRIILDMAEELSRLGGDPEAIIARNLQSLDGP